jgi:hypothetical protein
MRLDVRSGVKVEQESANAMQYASFEAYKQASKDLGVKKTDKELKTIWNEGKARQQAVSVAKNSPRGIMRGIMMTKYGDVVWNDAEAVKGLDNVTLEQGIETPEQGKFMRGTKGKALGMTPNETASHVVARLINDGHIIPERDGCNTVEEAVVLSKKIERNMPEVSDDKKGLRYKKQIKDGVVVYGNEKMSFPNESYPNGRNTYDIQGCGRLAFVVKNGVTTQGACYGTAGKPCGLCYAEAIGKATGRSISSGEANVGVTDKAVREEIINII